MFTRFRQTKHRLQVSLVETRRASGKVRHEHVASLGAVEVPQSVRARLAFWQRLHERLARLSNRVDATMQARILSDVHGRIPMVTPDEQRSLQLENAEADASFWGTLRDMGQGMAEGNAALAAKAEQDAAKARASAADADAKAVVAKERIERLKKGEDVQGGLGKRMTRKDMIAILKAGGMTDSDIRHCRDVADLSELGAFEEYCNASTDATFKASDRIDKAIARRMLADRLKPDA